MVRKLAPVLALLVVLLPGLVKALGLGDIQLDSYLNQPLKAEIELISATQGEVDGIKVKLATPAEFTNAGLEYNQILRSLKFKVIRKSNGKHYIQVSTTDSFREPFLNFLLEINWAKGRILREYTLLIDPPTLVKSGQPVTSAAPPRPSVSAPPVAATRPPEQRDSGRFGGPDIQQDTGKTGVIGSGYRTQRNDTTWGIAQRIRPDGDVSIEQAMLALVRSNPQAFMGQNINRLKAGYLINIPDRDAMTSISKTEAQALVAEHTRAWREGRSIATTGKPAAPTAKGKLEILPPKMDGKPVTGSQSTGAPGTDAARLHREALLAKEAAEAQKQENSELRMRISELEAQIKNQKRLATMKDDQLAALQKKLAELQAQTGKTAIPPVATTTPPAAETGVSEKKPTETAPAAGQKPIVEAKPATPGTPVNRHVVGGFKPVDIDKLPKTEVPAKPFKTEPATTPTKPAAESKPAEGGFVEMVKGYFKDEPLTAWLIVAAVVLLVLLTIILIVQRRRGGSQFEESILRERPDTATAAVATAAAATATAAAMSSGVGAEQEEEEEEVVAVAEESHAEDSAFVSDFVLSDMSDLQEGGEADPLTEADVFLAYGRFGPAENMIKDAIAAEPERTDLRLKLLEIYYAAKNSESFQTEVEAFQKHLDDHPDAESWAKAVEMAEDLCPDSPVLKGAGAAEESLDLEESLSEMEDFDLNAELEKTQSSEEDTSVLDFDLGEFEEQIESMGGGDKEEGDTLGGLGELDLDLDLDAIQSEGQPKSEQEELEDSLTDDLASELEDLADTMSMDAATPGSEHDTQSFDANELSSELDLDALEQPEESVLDAGVESDLTDLDLDEDVLGDLDEVGTKLDLAKAYIDMGDPEGARSILQEVLEEGNDQQKAEAGGLMQQIS